MPDLTPDAFDEERVQEIEQSFLPGHEPPFEFLASPKGWEARYRANVPYLVDCIRQFQRDKAHAFTEGRKQGWQDAGLSLDAQEVLAASLDARTHSHPDSADLALLEAHAQQTHDGMSPADAPDHTA